MTKAEVAKLTRRSTKTIERAHARGELECLRGARGPLYTRVHVACYLARTLDTAGAA